MKETAATQPTHKASAPAEQENGSEEEDEDDKDDEEEDEEDENEEEDEEDEKDVQTAKEKSRKEESSESSSESDSDDERTKEERMYDKAKRRIEVRKGEKCDRRDHKHKVRRCREGQMGWENFLQ